MKTLLRVSFVLVAILAGCCTGAGLTSNPLVSLATAPLHQLLTGWKGDIEGWTANSSVLQVMDFNHTLGRLFDFGEKQLVDLVFGDMVPQLMALLKDPAIQLRNLLAALLDRLRVIDPKNLVDQLAAFVRRIVPLVQLGVKVLDQVGAGQLDPSSFALPSLASGAQMAGAVAEAAKGVGNAIPFWPFN